MSSYKMEDNLNCSGKGRRPQFLRKWKTTSISQETEDDLNFRKWKTTSIFRKWKTTSIFRDKEDDLNSISADTKYFLNISID
jgi:hypothetical protein